MTPASCDALARLPGRSSFLMARELAAAECIAARERMSLILVDVRVDEPSNPWWTDWCAAAWQSGAKVVRLVAARDGRIGYLGNGRFGVMLPAVEPCTTLRLATSLQTGLALHLGQCSVNVAIGAALTPVSATWCSFQLLRLAEWRVSQCLPQNGRLSPNVAGFDPYLPYYCKWPSYSHRLAIEQ